MAKYKKLEDMNADQIIEKILEIADRQYKVGLKQMLRDALVRLSKEPGLIELYKQYRSQVRIGKIGVDT
jgi:hypothetical protein